MWLPRTSFTSRFTSSSSVSPHRSGASERNASVSSSSWVIGSPPIAPPFAFGPPSQPISKQGGRHPIGGNLSQPAKKHDELKWFHYSPPRQFLHITR